MRWLCTLNEYATVIGAVATVFYVALGDESKLDLWSMLHAVPLSVLMRLAH
jgi:hypothetical protein